MSTSTETLHAARPHDHAHDADDGAVHAHISSATFYIGILMALLVLTIITVAASRVDFGSGNTIIAIAIATVKAALVATFFMHLRYDKLFHTLAFLSSFLFLAIFLLLTADDLERRAEVDATYGGKWEHGEHAVGGQPAPAAPAPETAASAGAPGGEAPKK